MKIGGWRMGVTLPAPTYTALVPVLTELAVYPKCDMKFWYYLSNSPSESPFEWAEPTSKITCPVSPAYPPKSWNLWSWGGGTHPSTAIDDNLLVFSLRLSRENRSTRSDAYKLNIKGEALTSKLSHLILTWNGSPQSHGKRAEPHCAHMAKPSQPRRHEGLRRQSRYPV